jgi:hypothetical protein
MNEAATTDPQWERRSWGIDALTFGLPSADEKDDKEAAAAKDQLANILAAAVTKLERENAVFRKWAGDGAQGLAAASNELQHLQRTRSGIYALEGWGLPLTQSVLRGFVQLKEAGQVDPHLELAAGNLIGALAIRYSLERALWAQSMRVDPLGTQNDFVDYNALMLEAYGWARLIFARAPNDTGLSDTALSCASTLLHLVASPAPTPAHAGERTQAGGIAQGSSLLARSNALRALRMTRRILWPAEPR